MKRGKQVFTPTFPLRFRGGRLLKKAPHFKTSGAPVALNPGIGYCHGMESPTEARQYMTMIDQAESYHDLVVFRSRYFSLIERTLDKQQCQAVKDRWQARAKDDSLPIAPALKA